MASPSRPFGKAEAVPPFVVGPDDRRELGGARHQGRHVGADGGMGELGGDRAVAGRGDQADVVDQRGLGDQRDALRRETEPGGDRRGRMGDARVVVLGRVRPGIEAPAERLQRLQVPGGRAACDRGAGHHDHRHVDESVQQRGAVRLEHAVGVREQPDHDLGVLGVLRAADGDQAADPEVQQRLVAVDEQHAGRAGHRREDPVPRRQIERGEAVGDVAHGNDLESVARAGRDEAADGPRRAHGHLEQEPQRGDVIGRRSQ